MLFKKVKDIRNRLLYTKFEKLKYIKKFVIINLLSKLRLNFKNSQQLSLVILKLDKKHISRVKLVRRCILTNRNRRVVRLYNLSHPIFNKLMQFGLIPGCKKAIW